MWSKTLFVKLTLHGPSMFAVKAKIYGVIYNQLSSIAFVETDSIGQRQKVPNFSAFHWSPHGSLVFIGQHFVITRVACLPKRTETSLITESDRSGPIHRIGPGCAGRAYLQQLFFIIKWTCQSLYVGLRFSQVFITHLTKSFQPGPEVIKIFHAQLS